MKRYVQMLVLMALLAPLTGLAREETQEERRQRIMRKYLRERTTTVQSDLVVPLDEEPEDDELLDSQRFIEPEVNIQRQEGGVRPPPQMPRRPIQKTENRNWLLDEDPVDDPYEDPYATEEEKGLEKKPFSQWEYQDASKSSQDPRKSWTQVQNEERGTSLFNNRGDESASRFSPGASQSRDPYTSRYSGILNFQQDGSSRKTPDVQNPFNRLLPATSTQSERRDGNQGRDFGSEGPTFGSDPRAQQAPLRIPYQSPAYGSPRNSAQPNATPPEFQQPNTYQEWKDKKDSASPLGDDPFRNFGN